MQQTPYTNRQIWHIAYPILISLIMEQMIGMTDTAFLGRVGEVELGARKTTKPSASCSTTASTSRCAWPQ